MNRCGLQEYVGEVTDLQTSTDLSFSFIQIIHLQKIDRYSLVFSLSYCMTYINVSIHKNTLTNECQKKIQGTHFWYGSTNNCAPLQSTYSLMIIELHSKFFSKLSSLIAREPIILAATCVMVRFPTITSDKK